MLSWHVYPNLWYHGSPLIVSDNNGNRTLWFVHRECITTVNRTMPRLLCDDRFTESVKVMDLYFWFVVWGAYLHYHSWIVNALLVLFEPRLRLICDNRFTARFDVMDVLFYFVLFGMSLNVIRRNWDESWQASMWCYFFLFYSFQCVGRV